MYYYISTSSFIFVIVSILYTFTFSIFGHFQISLCDIICAFNVFITDFSNLFFSSLKKMMPNMYDVVDPDAKIFCLQSSHTDSLDYCWCLFLRHLLFLTQHRLRIKCSFYPITKIDIVFEQNRTSIVCVTSL